MRKVILIASLIMLASCGINVEEEITEETSGVTNELIFNTPEVEYHYNISFGSPGFHFSITDEQFNQVFPTLEMTAHEWNWATVYYHLDGTIAEVSTRIQLSNDSAHWLEVRVGFGGTPMVNSEYGFARDTVFEYSDIHGVLVNAIMIRNDWDGMFSFDTSFVMNGRHYRVRFRDYEESGKNRMTETVIGLIETNGAGFVILENPVIPEMWSYELTFDEARQDPTFSAFVPTAIPDDFVFQSGFRSFREYANENILSLWWDIPSDKAELYEIYIQWINERTTDTPVFAFDEIFWMNGRVSWWISPIHEHDFASIRSVNEGPRAPGEQPIFLAEEVTLELIQSHEWVQQSFPQGADWYEGEDEANVFLPLSTSSVHIRVLFDDVLINIHAESRNMMSEIIFEMLTSLME